MLGINLTRKVQNLYEENDKTPKRPNVALKQWKRPYLEIGRPNIIKDVN